MWTSRPKSRPRPPSSRRRCDGRLTTAQRLDALEAESARARRDLDALGEMLRLTYDAGYAHGRASVTGSGAATPQDREIRRLARGSRLQALQGGAS